MVQLPHVVIFLHVATTLFIPEHIPVVTRSEMGVLVDSVQQSAKGSCIFKTIARGRIINATCSFTL